MAKAIYRFCALVIFIALIPAWVSAYQLTGVSISDIETIEDLDALAAFSFAIMSDNKGESPVSSAAFKRMTEWIDTSNDRFIIGLGDHVKKGYGNTFLAFPRLQGLLPNFRNHAREMTVGCVPMYIGIAHAETIKYLRVLVP